MAELIYFIWSSLLLFSLKDPKKERSDRSAVLEVVVVVDFCLCLVGFCLFWIKIEKQRISKDNSELPQEETPAQTSCSIWYALFSILALLTLNSLGYIEVAVVWIFSSTVWWFCFSGRLWVEHTGESWDKKDYFYPVSTWAQLESFRISSCNSEILNVSQSQTGHIWVCWGLILLSPC